MGNRSLVCGLLAFAILGAGCAGSAKSYRGVEGFQKERYLGKWYEVARLDFAFERGLNNTTAEYAPAGEGKISVLNRGYDARKDKWKTASGKARFRGADTVGELEVSFFGPFYGEYNVIALDSGYQHALIAGSSTEYMWILSRTPSLPDDVRRNYLGMAQSHGFDTTKLIWVRHDR